MKSEKWGLALSGGGARGILHLGVLQALEERGVEISCIAGTSIGAIIGAMYAAGHSPEMMLKLLSGKSFLNMFSLKPSFRGLLEMKYLKRVLQAELPNDFETLKIPFYACSTNLSKQEEVVFHAGDLHQAVMASCCIPILFDPIVIDGNLYVDGGVLNNLPAIYCQGQCDKILGVDSNYGQFNPRLNNIKDIAMEVFHLTVQRNTADGLKLCDAVIRPFLTPTYHMMDFTKAKDLFDLGREETLKWFDNRLLESKEKRALRIN